jgi:hypothetical protein
LLALICQGAFLPVSAAAENLRPSDAELQEQLRNFEQQVAPKQP